MRMGLAAVVVLSISAACAQVRVNSGEVAGSVHTGDGRPVANATVTLRDPDRGISEAVVSDKDGLYRVPLVPPGTYAVEFGASGYAVETFEAVEVNVGESVRLDAALTFAGARFKVDVTTTALPLDFVRTHQASTVTSERIENLPINQRNYLSFALLTPGVSESVTVANAFDFRTPQTPTSGISFAGGTGRGNSFSIDGIENNGNVGNVRLSLPQEAVQEFQVNRNSYPAEYGGAYGGTLNIVSKSGTNEYHEEVFGYLRQRDIQARNYFDPAKSAYTRVQSGFGAGGPWRKNRLFYFASFERLDRHESAFVPLLADRSFLTSLTPGQQQIVTALSKSGDPQLGAAAALLRGLLTPANFPQVPAIFEANSGVFPFGGASSIGSLRLDANLADTKSLFFRFNMGQQDLQNTRFGAQTGYTRGNTTSILGGTALASYTQRYNPHWTGVTRLAFAYDSVHMNANDPIGPAIDINGFGAFGRDGNLPYWRYERHNQTQQSFDYFRSRHSLKFGFDFNPLRSNGFVNSSRDGSFSFGEVLPLGLVLGGINPALPGSLASALNALGGPSLAARLNDPLNSLQAYALGLPVGYLQTFGPKIEIPTWQHRGSAFIEEGYRASSNLTLNLGLRFQADANTSFPTQHFLDPRFGFAWSPGGSSKLVVRGGYGIYHSWTDIQISFLANSFLPPLKVDILFVPITGLPGVINPLTGLPLTSVDLYQSFQAKGILGRREIQFSDLAAFGVRPGFQFPSDGALDPSFQSPGAQQASLQVERSFGSSLVLSAGYDFSRVQHLPRERDHNLYQAGTRADGSPIFGRFNPNIFTDYVVESTGNSFYNGLILQVEKRFQNRWALNAHYTFSRAIDDVTDYDPQFTPNNPLDIRGDRGLATFHQKHRFTLSGVYESPAASQSATLGKKLLAGWTLSPIVSAYSWRPFNVLTGYDNLGDGQTQNHRPWGLGRNAGIGPGYFSMDARIARSIRLSRDGAAQVQLIGEVFNLLNHTNFEAVNNIVGSTPLSALPHPIEGIRGDPVQPLSFTSAKDPRQFQFGLKFRF